VAYKSHISDDLKLPKHTGLRVDNVTMPEDNAENVFLVPRTAK